MDFPTWFFAEGGYVHPFAEIKSDAVDGQFLRVRPGSPISPGSTIVSCPRHLTMSYANALKFGISPGGRRVEASSFAQTVAIRLFLMDQYLLGERSHWWPWMQSLPPPYQRNSFHTPLWYSENDIAWLQGTNLGNATSERKDTWRQEYQDATKLLFPKGLDDQQQKHWTWDLYIWAATVMSSRSFPSSAIADAMVDSPVLIPGLDLLNHSPSARVTWTWGSNSCAIAADELLPEGSQIFNNYGPKGNEELLMGYGFCLSPNPADRFSLGFSPAFCQHVEFAKARRLKATSKIGQSQTGEIRDALQSSPQQDGQSRKEDSNGSDSNTETSAPMNLHCVRLISRPSNEARSDEPPYEFSPGFLSDFSLAISNHRESTIPLSCTPSLGSFANVSLSRNKLHVMCAIIMILQQKQAAIGTHDKELPERPLNQNQEYAFIYRSSQVRILARVLDALSATLHSFISIGPSQDSQIVRLEHILIQSPKSLAKDFRGVVHTALGTRDADKIKQRGGVECAFALWLCGLWVLDQRQVLEAASLFEATIVEWMQFLRATYGSSIATLDSLCDIEVGMEPDDISDTATSYFEAVQTAVAKHPDSLYSSPEITAVRLGWCLRIIREESVRCPNLEAKMTQNDDDDNDEFVLFLAGERKSENDVKSY